jgi:hypothetical protein
VWGVISERMDIRHSSLIMFLVQSAGLALVLVTSQMMPVYLGFFLYGIGLGGGWVLQELIGRPTSAASPSAWCAVWVFS